MTPQQLTQDEVDHFVRHGYVVVKNCFDPASAQEWIARAWVRFGYDRDAPDQWVEKRIQLSTQDSVDARDFAPRAWAAAVQLLGGEDRIDLPWRWGDGFIANLGVGDDRAWEPPSAEVGGWHKDGDFFRHFLDSPEQGLLTIVLWTDMHHQGGGTFIAADSVPVVARHLAEHPEGVLPTDFDFAELVSRCTDFRELTGEAGDVVLLHPYVLHATSQNVIKDGRLITNPPVALRAPMRFDRAEEDELSPVERAVLHGLGLERLDFRPTGERELVVPPRVLEQQARDARAAERAAAAETAASR
ncbi:phytanoyl-CoA dioxygenase family protein [Microlunatus flavus]|uniref:Phytanoyl-CoA dioxygenase (PhyH) n=1 Tax=Microlunatus flavus TaxID=1036181 RepID=A0A1H9AKG2_9ACTN|nr:phytanoyl-CoA dioxygenase family protein [Microlunatus flavus]SEP76991.1 Phytanoyl-CoA dioxygenase (PhyH) [Microlunatus flavus]